jgi:hypothetical protein
MGGGGGGGGGNLTDVLLYQLPGGMENHENPEENRCLSPGPRAFLRHEMPGTTALELLTMVN